MKTRESYVLSPWCCVPVTWKNLTAKEKESEWDLCLSNFVLGSDKKAALIYPKAYFFKNKTPSGQGLTFQDGK